MSQLTGVMEWVRALELKGCNPVLKGKEWHALCPSHEDKVPSFNMTEGDGGKVLAYCHAGCTFEDYLRDLGLKKPKGTRPSTPARAPRKPKKEKPPPKPRRLPSGQHVTVYEYRDAEGAWVLAVVRWDIPGKPKDFKQFTPAPDKPGYWLPGSLTKRPLYGLPELLKTKGAVVVVEGEKCVHAVKQAWPKRAVTTWPGGANAWRKADFAPLAGRSVSLVADSDERNKRGEVPGHKAMLGVAQILHELGCEVKIALPPEEWETDIADWLEAGGKKGAGKIISDLLKPYAPPPVEGAVTEDAVERELRAQAEGELRDNEHYRLVGLVGLLVAVQLKRAGQVGTYRRDRLTQVGTLIDIAPAAWWSDYAGIEKLTREAAQAIGDDIIRIADNLGQVDQSLFWGRGAVKMRDGRVVYHLGDRLLMQGTEVDLSADDSLVWLAEPAIELSGEATADQTRRMGEAIMKYRWASLADGKRFLGWMVASIIGGALEWRPHLMLTAPAASGKTWLLKEVLERFLGPLLTSISDATPAAIAKVTEHASLPIAIDEAEPSEEWVLELLKTLRAASSDFGSRIRVAPTGGVNFQQARFCALLAGAVAPALARADATRITPVAFGKPVEHWPIVRLSISEAMKHADAVRARVIRHAAEIVANATRLSGEFQDLGMDSREAMASAALTAGWHFWGVTGKRYGEQEVYSQPEQTGQTDASDALLEILALRHRVVNGELSVLQMLSDGGRSSELADLYGIRWKNDAMLIAAKHTGLARAMARTRWANADLRKLLLQLEGVRQSRNPYRFGSLRSRAVIIPAEALEGVGVELVFREAEKEQEAGF